MRVNRVGPGGEKRVEELADQQDDQRRSADGAHAGPVALAGFVNVEESTAARSGSYGGAILDGFFLVAFASLGLFLARVFGALVGFFLGHAVLAVIFSNLRHNNFCGSTNTPGGN